MHVILADVQSLSRQGIVSLLRDSFPDWSFLHSSSLAETMQHLGTGEAGTGNAGIGIGLAIVDLDLPGLNGSAGIRLLHEACPGLRIALLTNTDDWNTIVDCVAAGAHGYLLKADASDQLVHAMQILCSGSVYLPRRRPEHVPPVSGSYAALVPSVMARLTARQSDVLTLLVDGRSTKDIAKHLNLGIGTVKVHLAGVYRALAVRNRAEAVAWFHTAHHSIA